MTGPPSLSRAVRTCTRPRRSRCRGSLVNSIPPGLDPGLIRPPLPGTRSAAGLDFTLAAVEGPLEQPECNHLGLPKGHAGNQVASPAGRHRIMRSHHVEPEAPLRDPF